MNVCLVWAVNAYFLGDAKKEEKFYLLNFVLMILNTVLTKILIAFIKAYRSIISPFIGSNCRFEPTCSKYSIDALKAHGPYKGIFLMFKRIIKCHPFNKGGMDPVIK